MVDIQCSISLLCMRDFPCFVSAIYNTSNPFHFTPEKTAQFKSERGAQLRRCVHLTQEELGKLIGVQKAQLSKLEKNASNMRIETIIRIFDALKAHVKFQVELDSREWNLTA